MFDVRGMHPVFEGLCRMCNDYYMGYGRGFCSHLCALEYRNTYNNPVKKENVKVKISISRKGKPTVSGEQHWNWQGKKTVSLFCQDCGRLLRTINWGNKGREVKYCPKCKSKGSRSPHWRGGTTPQRIKESQTQQYFDFVKAILRRDNYTCRNCGITNGLGKKIKLHVHHIKSYAEYPELRFDINNGITLCNECHFETIKNKSRPNRVDKELQKRICQNCGKEFSIRNPRKFCLDCKNLKCIYCNSIFRAKNGDYSQKFCSRICYSKWCSKFRNGRNNPNWKPKMKLICEVCHNEYYVKPSISLISRFCSMQCRNKWQSYFMKIRNLESVMPV